MARLEQFSWPSGPISSSLLVGCLVDALEIAVKYIDPLKLRQLADAVEEKLDETLSAQDNSRAKEGIEAARSALHLIIRVD